MKKRSIILFTLVVVVVSGGLYLYYGYLYKEARNISEEKATHAITANRLAKEYEEDTQKANALYLNKTIEVSGKVTEASGTDAILDSVVFCSFNSGKQVGVQDSIVTVKGRCIGYDELLGEIKLDQCTIKE